MKKRIKILAVGLLFTICNCNNNEHSKKQDTVNCSLEKDSMVFNSITQYVPHSDILEDSFLYKQVLMVSPNCILLNAKYQEYFLFLLEKHYEYLLTHKSKTDFDVYNIPIWADSPIGKIVTLYFYDKSIFKLNSYDSILKVNPDWLLFEKVFAEGDSINKKSINGFEEMHKRIKEKRDSK